MQGPAVAGTQTEVVLPLVGDLAEVFKSQLAILEVLRRKEKLEKGGYPSCWHTYGHLSLKSETAKCMKGWAEAGPVEEERPTRRLRSPGREGGEDPGTQPL